jgi:hypothetical protein
MEKSMDLLTHLATFMPASDCVLLTDFIPMIPEKEVSGRFAYRLADVKTPNATSL